MATTTQPYEILHAACRVDAALEIGMVVTVRWTNSGMGYQGQGRVVKINQKSVRVALLADVAGNTGGWQAGNTIQVPRVGCGGSSPENGIFPAK